MGGMFEELSPGLALAALGFDDRATDEGAVIHSESVRRAAYWVALLGFLAFVVLAFAAGTEARRGDLETARTLVGTSIVALCAGAVAFTVTMSLEIRLLSRRERD